MSANSEFCTSEPNGKSTIFVEPNSYGCALREIVHTNIKPKTAPAKHATTAFAHSDASSLCNAINAPNEMMPTTISHTRRVLLTAGCVGDDVSMCAKFPVG